jgi:hypothetical protein
MIYWVDNGLDYSSHGVDIWSVPDDVAAEFEAWMTTQPRGKFIVARADFVEKPRPEDATSFVGFFSDEEDDDRLFSLEDFFGYDDDGEDIEKWAALPAGLQRWLMERAARYTHIEKHFTNLLKPAPTEDEKAAKRRAWAEERAVRIRRQDMANEIELDPHSTKATP